MKLSDCKPGVRVRVYDGELGCYTGSIATVNDDKMVVVSRMDSFSYHYPQQLRKLAPKKGKPEVIVAVFNDGWQAFSKNIDIAEIEELKKTWASVWLMRGVKKL